MKYPYPTTSKPATGKAAEKIRSAVESGGHAANDIAVARMKRLYAEHIAMDPRLTLPDQQVQMQPKRIQLLLEDGQDTA